MDATEHFSNFLPLLLLTKMCNVAPADCLVPVHFTTFVFEDNLMQSKSSYKQTPSGILHYLAGNQDDYVQ